MKKTPLLQKLDTFNYSLAFGQPADPLRYSIRKGFTIAISKNYINNLNTANK